MTKGPGLASPQSIPTVRALSDARGHVEAVDASERNAFARPGGRLLIEPRQDRGGTIDALGPLGRPTRSVAAAQNVPSDRGVYRRMIHVQPID